MKAIEWLSHGKAALKEELRGLAEELREGENPLEPFHWEVEFPEVFARENPGFDAVVGNPPFLGGKKISTNFSDAYKEWLVGLHEESNSNSEEEASRWPDLLDILRERHREKPRSSSEEVRAAPWWQFWRPRSGMNAALSILKKVLVVNCGASPHLALAFLPIGMVYSHTLSVFAFDSHAAFALLQSRSHEVWARFFASTFEDRLRYTPTGCFETFAFPDDWKTIATLESAGRNYYEFRAALMVRNNQGLTATYNRFHDPDERSPDILKLRELNAAMDRAVLDAYGWKDLEPTCEFLLDYEEDEEEDGEDAASSRSRGRRKPWRYRWPDDLRDEVLARLLALNRARAEEERLSSGASERNVPRPGKKRRKRT